MRKNKIGSLFLVSALALAGIGVSYAGFTDEISIYGEVETATVDLTILDYSGTDVWKVWNDDGTPPAGYEDEVYRWHGYDRPTEDDVLTTTGANNAELVSSAWAKPSSSDGFDVDLIWDNIFPCQDFKVDILLKYEGSIPAKLWAGIEVTNFENGANWDDYEGNAANWVEYLLSFPDAVTIEATLANCPDNGDGNGATTESVNIIDNGFQVHGGECILVEMTIHLPQPVDANVFQDCSAEFSAWIGAGQWNEDPDQLWPPEDA